MSKNHNYIIARFWDEETNHLASYTYHGEVHYGTEKEAEELAEFISKRSGQKYKPYYITTERDEKI